MKFLPEILESIGDGLEMLVELSNGNVFGLADFEMVDESIYQRQDLCVADIVSIIHVKNDVYKIGNKLEFSVNDVVEVRNPTNGDIVFHRESAP
jgi:hypothetical protein